MALTPYPALDAVVTEVAEQAAHVLGEQFVGAYLEGSFALGAGDEHSDVDFLVVLRGTLTAAQEEKLRAFHRELPTRSAHWAQHVEGSYALLADLLDGSGTARPWLFIDHGHQEMSYDIHGNDMVHRWVLHEHGLTIAGRPAAEVVAPVSAEQLRIEARRDLLTVRADIVDWCNLDIAWCQRYLVLTACRALFTLATGTVGSKAGALQWAAGALDPQWRGLLTQTLTDRARGWDPRERPSPAVLQASLDFSEHAAEWSRLR